MNDFNTIEGALSKLAREHDLSYAAFQLHLDTKPFFSVNAHRGCLAKSGTGPTIEAALEEALSKDFLDTAPMVAESDRIAAAGRIALLNPEPTPAGEVVL